MPNSKDGNYNPTEAAKERRRQIFNKTWDELEHSVLYLNFRGKGNLPELETFKDHVTRTRKEIGDLLVASGFPKTKVEDELKFMERALNGFDLAFGMNEFDVEDFIEFGKFGPTKINLEDNEK